MAYFYLVMALFLFRDGILFITKAHMTFFFFGKLKSLQVLVYIRDATHLNADLELEQQMEQ